MLAGTDDFGCLLRLICEPTERLWDWNVGHDRPFRPTLILWQKLRSGRVSLSNWICMTKRAQCSSSSSTSKAEFIWIYQSREAAEAALALPEPLPKDRLLSPALIAPFFWINRLTLRANEPADASGNLPRLHQQIFNMSRLQYCKELRTSPLASHVLWKIQQMDELFCISSLEEPKVKHTGALLAGAGSCKCVVKWFRTITPCLVEWGVVAQN